INDIAGYGNGGDPANAKSKLDTLVGRIFTTKPDVKVIVALNVYAHLIKPHDQSAANRLEATIFETTGSKTVAINEKGVTASTVTP
ncbi:MAG: hypothetical protein R6V60_06845, partial [Desulfobacterales bacterium]